MNPIARLVPLGALVAASLGAPAFQAPRPAAPGTPAAATQASAGETGTIDFRSKVGSFKILSPNSDVKARGRITMSFSGSVLVVGLDGNVTPGSGVRLQYKDDAHARQTFFGKGTLTVDGRWRAIQFFGRDFSGHWDGMGIMRLYGEFDDKLETGTYVIKGDEPRPWGNGGMTVVLPKPPDATKRAKPRIEDVKKKPGAPK